jgi:hypothetical protein
MKFEKYSKQQFELVGRDTPAGRQLADELQAEVNEHVHAAVLPVFMNIVDRLNAEGHNLTAYDPIVAGDITFRDESSESDCHLRLACDVVISAGYADTLKTADPIAAEPAKDVP